MEKIPILEILDIPKVEIINIPKLKRLDTTKIKLNPYKINENEIELWGQILKGGING